MILESQLFAQLVTAIATGTIISGLAALAADATSFSWRKFLYTLGLTSISGLLVIQGIQDGVTLDNAINVFLEIVGASFLANKLFGIGSKLKGLTTG